MCKSFGAVILLFPEDSILFASHREAYWQRKRALRFFFKGKYAFVPGDVGVIAVDDGARVAQTAAARSSDVLIAD